jgi:hypothetical protein
MKLPATVRVGPFKFKLVRTNADDKNECGYFDATTREIGLAKPEDWVSEDEEASTLIHELGHAIMHVHWRGSELDSEELQEKLELIITQICRDNKSLVRAILKALK